MTKHSIDLPEFCTVHCFDIIGSTNDEAKKMAEKGNPAWTIIWAKTQTDGRGRTGKTWQSRPGNLYMSAILWPESAPEILPQLSFVTAVAIRKALGLKIGNVGFKWPNDILLNSKKVAGILLESGMAHGKRWLVIGIGVNIKEFPNDADYPATSIYNDSRETKISPEQLLSAITKNLVTEIANWEKSGFSGYRTKWLKFAHGIGRPVNVKLGKEIASGIFDDLDEEGNLILRQEGNSRKISAGELFFENFGEANVTRH